MYRFFVCVLPIKYYVYILKMYRQRHPFIVNDSRSAVLHNEHDVINRF